MEKNNNIYSINLIVQNKNYKSISDQIICPLCKKLKLNAKITNCSNNCQVSLCGFCAKMTDRCPECGEQPNWNNCLAIKQLISSLDFKCKKCEAIFNFDDLKDHYTTHEINDNPVVLTDKSLQINSNELLRNQVVRYNISRNRENNNNNSERFNFYDFLKSERFGKLINFYNIIFY